MTDQPKPTPPLADFLSRYEEDDNEWWGLSSGDHQNLFDAAVWRAVNAEQRLELARQALLSDGYFTADEVGLDVAPRILERLGGLRQRAEIAEARLRNALDDLAREKDAHSRDVVRAVRAEAKIARLDKLHQPRHVTEIVPCEAHRQFTSANAVASHVCPNCVSRPALACKDIRCCSWPCEPHLALHDETAETCAHRAGELSEAPPRGGPVDFGEVADDHGNAWPRCSETCDIHVVRPGFARCQCEPEEYPL